MAFNFSAGPPTIPHEVLVKIQNEILDYHGTGLSEMTFSHRSSLFIDILQAFLTDLRALLFIPKEYEIICMQGGGSLQFVDAAFNLSLERNRKVGCVVSGHWSALAYQQMRKIALLKTVLSASSEENGEFLNVPPVESWKIEADMDFIHFTSNETAHGVQYHDLPKLKDNNPTLVCDMSSDILSRLVNIREYGLIYASAQKNIGPAGVTIIIIRKDLMQRAGDNFPDVLRYASYPPNDGMYHTPPTFSIYVCGLVTSWLRKLGGIPYICEFNQKKSDKLYAAIDNSDGFYRNKVNKKSRSIMNIVFQTKNKDLDSAFVKEAEEKKLYFLKGHKAVGGMRASLYNAMPMEGVEALINFMHDFKKKYQ